MKTLLLILIPFFIYQTSFGGEGVGNYRPTQPEPLFQLASAKVYYVQVPKGLTVRHQTADVTSIDNSGLISGQQPMSSVRFDLLNNDPSYSQIRTVQAIKEYLSRNSKRDWQQFEVAGAKGFMSEVKTATHLKGVYYLLTNNLDLVRATVDADTQGDGLTLITPIVHTFTYDVTPPVIKQMKLDGSSEVVAGGTVRILLNIVDDLSGVNATINQFRSGNFLSTDQEFSPKSFTASQYKISSLGKDWYSLEYTIGTNVEPGEYVFGGVAFSDNANNYTQVYVGYLDKANIYVPNYRNGDLPYYSGKNLNDTEWQPMPNLPLIKVKISNPNPIDKTPLAFAEVKLKTETVKAGNKLTVLAHLPNAASKFRKTPSAFGQNTLSGSWFATITPTNSSEKDSGGGYSNGILESSELGNDWVAVNYTTGFKTPVGEYYLSFLNIMDWNRKSTALRADSKHEFYLDANSQSTGIPVVKFQVLPDDRADKTPPTLRALKVNGDFNIGNKDAAVLANIVDDLSGIDPNSNIYGEVVALDPKANGAHFDVRNSKVSHHISSGGMAYGVTESQAPYSGNNWYTLFADFTDFLPPGEYYLAELHVQDRSQNFTTIRANLQDGFYHIGPDYGADGSSTGIPVLKITVTR